jgi:hypothetical protein
VQREKGFLRRRALKCWEGKLEDGILEMAGVTLSSHKIVPNGEKGENGRMGF